MNFNIHKSSSASALCIHRVAARAHFAKVCLNYSEHCFKINDDNKYILPLSGPVLCQKIMKVDV